MKNNPIFEKNYIMNDCKKFICLKHKIVSSNDSFFSKIVNKFRTIKCNKILYKNNASIPVHNKNLWGGYCIEFPHGLSGIFISQGAKIGNNCTIFHQVTIGSNTLKDSKNVGAPIIGDNVYIGAGAKIIGNVKIGNNVRIGANAIVTIDVPDNATVVMNHPKIIIHHNERNNKFISYDKIETKNN